MLNLSPKLGILYFSMYISNSYEKETFNFRNFEQYEYERLELKDQISYQSIKNNFNLIFHQKNQRVIPYPIHHHF